MKLLSFVVVAMATITGSVFADIPSPSVDQLTISGPDAVDLAKSLPGDYKEKAGETGHMFTVKHKELRTGRGMTQIQCVQLVYTKSQKVKSETCRIQKSNNGVPLEMGSH